ncbi:MAG TPA: hypothetical protein VK488_07775 [Gaiellaceae bacterium]|nr:hypothetical protein [Gaiellaceae bacterium]
MASLAVREHERSRLRTAAGEVEIDELTPDRLEELRLAAALRLRRGDLAAGDGPLDAQALSWTAAIVEDVAPDERVRLGRAQALIGEHADERGVLRVELRTDRLDRFRRARIDRLGAGVCDTANPDDGIPTEVSPFHGSVEDALKDAKRSVDRGRAGAVDAELCRVGVDRLARNLTQTLAAEVRDDPLVEQRRVGLERVRAQVGDRVGVPPLHQELLEHRVRADHFRGELAELASAADRGLEELGVSAAVEGALAPGTGTPTLVPANDVDAPAVATPEPLDAHPVATVVDRRKRRGRRSERVLRRRPGSAGSSAGA